MSKKITGNAIVDGIFSALEKDFGKAFVFKGPKYEEAEPITTSSSVLDSALGIGGIPRGRIIEIFGPESSGKTSMALRVMSNYKIKFPNDKRPLVIIDMERSILPSLITSMGLDPNEIVFCYPDTAEEALETLVRLNACGQVGFVLLDSIDSLQSKERLKKDIGESDMQGIAKMVGTTMRQISKTSIENNTTNILINQIRDTLSPYGEPHTTPGGKAIKFYASVRMETMKQKESPEVENAFLMRVKIIKNKCSPPHAQPVEIHFQYGKGPDPYVDLVGFAKSLSVVRFAGTAVYANVGEGEVKLTAVGQSGLAKLLRTDATLYEKIRKYCLDYFIKKELKVPDTVEADEEPDDESETTA